MRDVQEAIAWYREAFPTAKVVSYSSAEFSFLAIGDFAIELVYADDKVASGKAGTVLYWLVDNLDQEIVRFEKLGSIVYRGPMAIGDGLGICQVTDPYGNLIGLRGKFKRSST